MADWREEAEAACEAATDNWQLTKATDKSAEINRYGFYVFKGMWGAVAVCPKESPQFGAHKNNMEFIALARTALPRALKALRAADELIAQYSQLLPTDLPPGAELRLEDAEAAYRKARK